MRSRYRSCSLLPAIAALLPGALAAQSFLYSPAAAATADANSENSIPFGYASARYQQAHGDLTMPGTITGLALRRDGRLGPSSTATARTLDAALYCFHANPGRPSVLFDSNRATSPTAVVRRRPVNLPDFTQNLGNPAPWSIVLTFDVPFSFLGNQPFGWELLVFSTTATGAYFADSYESIRTYGPVTNTGIGCVATGRSAPMTLSPLTWTTGVGSVIAMRWSMGEAPAGAQSTFLIGTGPLALPIPGLCSSLYVQGIFLTLNATASAAGAVFMPQLTVSFDPAFVGVSLHGQGASVDAGQSGLPVAVTHGARVTIAPPPPQLPIYRVYSSSVQSNTGTTDQSGNYGLALRLTR